MKTQTTQFAIEKKNNVVKNVGKSIIVQPKISFGGGHIKWYKDKLKKDK